MKTSTSKRLGRHSMLRLTTAKHALQLSVCLTLLATVSNTNLLAQYNGSFVDIQPVPGLEHPSAWDFISDISDDGLTVGITSSRGGSRNPRSWDLYQATRNSVDAPFGAPVKLGALSRPGIDDGNPTFSSDGLTSYFHSTSPAEVSSRLGLWTASRATLDSEWGEPQFLTDTAGSAHPSLSDDDLTLYFSYSGAAAAGRGRDLFKMERASPTEPFGDPQPVTELNTSGKSELSPRVSSEELAIVYTSYNNDSQRSDWKIMIATRPTKDEPFGEPVELDDFGLGSEINSSLGTSWHPVVSADWPADGSKLYYTGFDSLLRDWETYEATWNVYADGDANLDDEVNFADFLILSENFGQAGAWREGDFDGDGQVGFPDFLALSANFGGAANSSAAAVPEPTAATIAFFGLLGLVGFRKRR